MRVATTAVTRAREVRTPQAHAPASWRAIGFDSSEVSACGSPGEAKQDAQFHGLPSSGRAASKPRPCWRQHGWSAPMMRRTATNAVLAARLGR